MYKRPDSDYTRLKNTLATCVYCGEKFKYGSLKKHQKRKHAKQDPHPPIVKPGQVQLCRLSQIRVRGVRRTEAVMYLKRGRAAGAKILHFDA